MAAILRCLSPALPFGELSPLPLFPLLPPAARRSALLQRSVRRRGRAGGETRGGGREAGRDPEGRKDGAGGGRRKTDPRRGSAEEERVPPVIKGEEAEGEGRASGASSRDSQTQREEREAARLAPPFSLPSLPPFYGLSCRAAAAFLPSLFRLFHTQNDSAPWLPLTGMSLPGSACRCRPAVRQSCTYLRSPPTTTTAAMARGAGRPAGLP